MGFADHYFKRYKTEEQFIKAIPSANLGIIVAIPCFNESNTIKKALESLFCCKHPQKDVEVIININFPENKRDIYKTSHEELKSELSSWIEAHSVSKIKFFIISEELNAKTAGAGHARRIAMDEALRRFNLIDNKNGIIASFDADCVCDTNYFTELEKLYSEFPKTNGNSIYFEHPLEGDEYNLQQYNAIAQYELHLRYYIEALRFSGFPYAFHTIGSAFAVRAEAYAKQGGMNKRQAGEDFYFLHKIIPLENFRELNSTRIVASGRISDRVPFGTGTVIAELVRENNPVLFTYNPGLFYNLKKLFGYINYFLFKTPNEIEKYINALDASLVDFLYKNNFYIKLNEINDNVASVEAFTKRFFTWFNGLMVFQYLNESKELYGTIPVEEAAVRLLEIKGISSSGLNVFDLLLKYREIERYNIF